MARFEGIDEITELELAGAWSGVGWDTTLLIGQSNINLKLSV